MSSGDNRTNSSPQLNDKTAKLFLTIVKSEAGAFTFSVFVNVSEKCNHALGEFDEK